MSANSLKTLVLHFPPTSCESSRVCLARGAALHRLDPQNASRLRAPNSQAVARFGVQTRLRADSVELREPTSCRVVGDAQGVSQKSKSISHVGSQLMGCTPEGGPGLQTSLETLRSRTARVRLVKQVRSAHWSHFANTVLLTTATTLGGGPTTYSLYSRKRVPVDQCLPVPPTPQPG